MIGTNFQRHCERSEAIHNHHNLLLDWIATPSSRARNDGICFTILTLLAMTIFNPCHADPNTYLIKHQTGKNSKSILDKKFIHLNAPTQVVINENSDSKGLETLSSNIQKTTLPIIKSKPLIIKPSKVKASPAKDNSTWNDYAVEDSSIESFEELDVNAVIVSP